MPSYDDNEEHDWQKDSTPGLSGWLALAIGCSLIAFAAGIFWVLS